MNICLDIDKWTRMFHSEIGHTKTRNGTLDTGQWIWGVRLEKGF